MSDDWTPLRTADGSWTLRAPGHGEACHSLEGALEESRVRCAEACELRERARAQPALRVLDVGTGIGWNLVAALEALTAADDEPLARLEVVTLERDERVLAAADALPPLEANVASSARRAERRVRDALREARRAGRAHFGADDRRGVLELRLGDARSTVETLPREAIFDAILLDPFSRAREPALWAVPFLTELALRLRPDGLLSTYSAAFRVRAALVGAGFRVGRGPAFGNKLEGTLASRGRDVPPLAPKDAQRLRNVLVAGAGSVAPETP